MEEFAMAAAIGLRGDFDAGAMRAVAKRSKDGGHVRRLLALAAIYDGATRSEAAKIGGVTLQIVRDWVLKFNAHGPDGLVDRKAPGQAPRLKAEHRAALAAVLESGRISAVHGVVRWRIVDLVSHRAKARRRRARGSSPDRGRGGAAGGGGATAASGGASASHDAPYVVDGLILVAGLTSKTRSLMDLKTLAEWTIRPRLLAVPGVANISVFGRDSRSLQIQVRPDRLIRYRLGMNEILAPAQKATGVRGAGFIDTANQRVVLQSEGQSLTPEQLARTVLLTHGAARVTLSSPTAISFLDELGYLTFSASGGALLFHLLSNINSMSAPASSSRPISASESGQPCSATRR